MTHPAGTIVLPLHEWLICLTVFMSVTYTYIQFPAGSVMGYGSIMIHYRYSNLAINYNNPFKISRISFGGGFLLPETKPAILPLKIGLIPFSGAANLLLVWGSQGPKFPSSSPWGGSQGLEKTLFVSQKPPWRRAASDWSYEDMLVYMLFFSHMTSLLEKFQNSMFQCSNQISVPL